MAEMRTCRFRATEFNGGDFRHMVEALAASGVKIKCDMSRSGRSATVSVEVPSSLFDARMSRTRGAGRRPSPIVPPRGSEVFLDMTCEDFLSWLGDHTSQDGMRALGLKSPSAYYRRLRRIREAVARAEASNARGARMGIPPYMPRLRDMDS